MPVRRTRRQYLLAVGTVGTATIAGCSETETESGGDGTDEQPAGTDAEPTDDTDGGETDGDDETPGESESDAEETARTNRLQVVSAVGQVDGSAVGQVQITVKKAPGAGDIDLSGTTLQFVHSSGATELTFGSVGGTGSADSFGVRSIQDAGGASLQGTAPTLDDAADRAQLVLDTGAITTGGLGEGDTATVRVETASGGATELRLVVPETLGGASAVNVLGSSEAAGGEDTGSEETGQTTNRLREVGTVGTDISDGTIGRVEITVGRAPGAGDIELSATTMQFVHSSGTTDLTFTDGPADGDSFSVEAIQDSGETSLTGSSPVLDDDGDRARLVLDTGSIVPDGLGEGETATIRITTGSGGSTELRLVVPQTLGDARGVAL